MYNPMYCSGAIALTPDHLYTRVTAASAAGVMVADIDGDGDQDAVSRVLGAAPVFHLNNGTGFAPFATCGGCTTGSIAMVNADADGLNEFVFGPFAGSGAMSCFRNATTPCGFPGPWSVPSNATTGAQTLAAPLFGDGVLHLVLQRDDGVHLWMQSGSGFVAAPGLLWLRTGNISSAGAPSVSVDADPGLQACDLDNDGDLDLLELTRTPGPLTFGPFPANETVDADFTSSAVPNLPFVSLSINVAPSAARSMMFRFTPMRTAYGMAFSAASLRLTYKVLASCAGNTFTIYGELTPRANMDSWPLNATGTPPVPSRIAGLRTVASVSFVMPSGTVDTPFFLSADLSGVLAELHRRAGATYNRRLALIIVGSAGSPCSCQFHGTGGPAAYRPALQYTVETRPIVHRNNGKGLAFTPVPITTVTSMFALPALTAACGDISGDGWADIVLAGPGGTAVLLNTATGTAPFVAPAPPTPPIIPSPTDIARLSLADLDGDAMLDVLHTVATPGAVYVYRSAYPGPAPPFASGLAGLMVMARRVVKGVPITDVGASVWVAQCTPALGFINPATSYIPVPAADVHPWPWAYVAVNVSAGVTLCIRVNFTVPGAAVTRCLQPASLPVPRRIVLLSNASSDTCLFCGDGRTTAGESCDDGARSSGDGCSAACKLEPGYNCTTPPLGPTVCVLNTSFCPPLALPNGQLLPSLQRTINFGVSFQCNAGYILTQGGSEFYSCQENATWSFPPSFVGPPQCILKDPFCATLSPPANALFAAQCNRTLASACTTACNTGYALSGGAATRVCDPSMQWLPNINLATCPCQTAWCATPGPAPAGEVPNAVPSFCSGCIDTVCGPVACNTGYALMGAASVTCQLNHTWSAPFPQCPPIPNYCPPLATANGALAGCSRLVGGLCSVNCAAGYGRDSTDAALCLASTPSVGQWNASLDCQPIQGYCPALSAPPNGALGSCSAIIGGTCAVTCNPGYTLAGTATRTCVVPGVYSGSAVSCTLITNFCPSLLAPPPPASSVISCASRAVGAVCTLACNGGFNASGDAVRTCTVAGTWTGSTLACGACSGSCATCTGTPTNCATCLPGYFPPPGCPLMPSYCPPLSSVGGATLSTLATALGTLVNQTCGPNAGTNDTRVIACGPGSPSVGVWSAPLPVCYPNACFPELLPAPVDGTILQVVGTGVGAMQTFACNTGFAVSGSRVTVCGVSGAWNDSSPTCAAVTCAAIAPAPHVYVDPTAPSLFGSLATAQCYEGYIPSSPNTGLVYTVAVCGAVGELGVWNHTFDQLVCTPLPCPATPAPRCVDPNTGDLLATTACITGPDTGTVYRIGDSAVYTCETGYVSYPSNAATIHVPCVVRADVYGYYADWDGVNPACTARACAPPDDELPLHVVFANPRAYFYGETAAFTCDSSIYEIQPAGASLQCGADGLFTGSALAATCHLINCQENLTAIFSTFGAAVCTDAEHIGSVCSLTCNPGLTQYGPTVRTCQGTGLWSGPRAYCSNTDASRTTFDYVFVGGDYLDAHAYTTLANAPYMLRAGVKATYTFTLRTVDGDPSTAMAEPFYDELVMAAEYSATGAPGSFEPIKPLPGLATAYDNNFFADSMSFTLYAFPTLITKAGVYRLTVLVNGEAVADLDPLTVLGAQVVVQGVAAAASSLVRNPNADNLSKGRINEVFRFGLVPRDPFGNPIPPRVLTELGCQLGASGGVSVREGTACELRYGNRCDTPFSALCEGANYVVRVNVQLLPIPAPSPTAVAQSVIYDTLFDTAFPEGLHVLSFVPSVGGTFFVRVSTATAVGQSAGAFVELAGSPFIASIDASCLPGTFSPDISSANCVPCPALYFSNTTGATECTLCPPHTTTLSPMATNVANCSCVQGYYLPAALRARPDATPVCLDCDPNAFCAGGRAPCRANPGYFEDPRAECSMIRCPRPEACVGGFGQSVCARGYQGPMCNVCARGYYSSNRGQCLKCSPASKGLVVVAAIVIVLAVVLAVVAAVLRATAQARHLSMHAKSRLPYALTVGLLYAQIVNLLASTPVPWGNAVKSAMGPAQYLSLDFGVMVNECSLVDVYTKYLVQLAMPLLVLPATVLVVVVMRVLRARRPGLEWLPAWPLLVVLEKIYITLATLSYIPLARVVFGLFDCVRLHDGHYYLNSDIGNRCYTRPWYAAMPFGIVAIAFYIVLLPVYLAGMLWRHRHTLREAATLTRFGSVYQRYWARYYFFDVLALLRKLIIVVLSTFFTTQPLLMIGGLLLLFLLSVVVSLRLRPLFSPLGNSLDFWMFLCLALLLQIGLALYTGAFRGGALVFCVVIGIGALVGGVLQILRFGIMEVRTHHFPAVNEAHRDIFEGFAHKAEDFLAPSVIEELRRLTTPNDTPPPPDPVKDIDFEMTSASVPSGRPLSFAFDDSTDIALGELDDTQKTGLATF